MPLQSLGRRTLAVPELSLGNVLSSEYLLNPEPGFPSIAYGVLGALYLLLLLGGVWLYRYRERLFGRHRLNIRLAGTVATVAIALGACGVLLVALRYLAVPVLSARVLAYLLVLVSLILLGYFVYYLRSRYPASLARHAAEELRQRYMPRPKARPAVTPSRISHARKAKGKRRR